MPMIPILSYPDFNGSRYSRTSADVAVDGALRLPGVLQLDIERKLTPGKSWGSRAKPQTRTRGKFEPSGKLKLFLEDYNILLNYLTAKGAPFGQGSFEVSFLLTVTVFEPGLGTTLWELRACRITGESSSPVTDGDDKEIEVSLDLDVMDILKDGAGVVLEQSPFGQIGG